MIPLSKINLPISNASHSLLLGYSIVVSFRFPSASERGSFAINIFRKGVVQESVTAGYSVLPGVYRA